ncbi:MAG TPA: hypothetical protein VN442_18460 [Bryobacteraceae bacterium]|nr:hypothetical protein [Bryobacteraceae bacterium]
MKSVAMVLASGLALAMMMAGQTADTPAAPAQTVAQPVATIPVPAVMDEVPEGATKDTTLWWASVGGNGLATFLKWNSSWKQPALDLVHAEPGGPYQGKYYVRATIYDWGVFGLTTAVQYFLCRKFPNLKKSFTYVNFGSSAVSMAQFGYNQAQH